MNDLMNNILQVITDAGTGITDDVSTDLVNAIKATNPTDFLVEHEAGGGHTDITADSADVDGQVQAGSATTKWRVFTSTNFAKVTFNAEATGANWDADTTTVPAYMIKFDSTGGNEKVSLFKKSDTSSQWADAAWDSGEFVLLDDSGNTRIDGDLTLNSDIRLQRTGAETMVIDNNAAGNITLLSILSDSIVLSDIVRIDGDLFINADTRIRRSATKTITVDDGVGGALTKLNLDATDTAVTGDLLFSSTEDARIFRSGVKVLDIDDGAGTNLNFINMLADETTYLGDINCNFPTTGEPVAFSVHKNGTNQTITTATLTKVTWSTEDFDTHSDFASGTFTPQFAGKYMLTASISFDSVSTAFLVDVHIYKNGTIYKTTEAITGAVASDPTYNVTIVADANGTTDNFEVYVRHTKGSDQDVDGGSTRTWFHGHRIAFS
jgi:hypothetical protein